MNIERVKIGAALLLTSPYVPLLFQGEEWGASSPFQYFVDFRHEPELAQAVAEGRQKEFGAFGLKPEDVPDPTVESALLASTLHWDELNRPYHAELLDWYRQLIQLRTEVPSFTTGRLDYTSATCDEDLAWLIVCRGPVTIICNFAHESRNIPVESAKMTVLLSSKPLVAAIDSEVTLAAESVVILAAQHEFNGHSTQTFRLRHPAEKIERVTKIKSVNGVLATK
jgi:maltooligosyltrehalose trehalohydrolase